MASTLSLTRPVSPRLADVREPRKRPLPPLWNKMICLEAIRVERQQYSHLEPLLATSLLLPSNRYQVRDVLPLSNRRTGFHLGCSSTRYPAILRNTKVEMTTQGKGGRMTVVIDLDGRCFRLCTLFWDGSDWVKCLRSLEFWTLGKVKFYFLSMSKFQYWIIITRCSENDNNVVKIHLSVLVFKLNWQDLQNDCEVKRWKMSESQNWRRKERNECGLLVSRRVFASGQVTRSIYRRTCGL